MSVTKHHFTNKKMKRKRFFMYDAPINVGLFLLVVTQLLLVSPVAALPSGLRITIGTFSPHFSPKLAKITTGTTISWENPTAALHSITHDGCKKGERCAFDSGPLGPTRTFTLKELPPGYYPYHCSFHPIMRGVLIVREPGGGNET